MLRKLVIFAVILAIVGAAAFWFITMPATVPASALAPYAPNPDNGARMFHAGGCASCHATPNQEDKTRLGGGLALKSPFGTFFTPNISPDRKDGIGNWSEADFLTAMWKGTSPGGSHYYPAFPYTSYQHMKMEDVRDLFAYLKTRPRSRASRATMSCRSISRSAACWEAGNSFILTAGNSSPIQRSRRR
jgi:hypothetical protein